LEDALRVADHPAVVLGGPPGVGKSRLALEALERARAQGWLVQQAVATQAAATIPFGALAQLLPDLPSGTERAAVLRGAVEALRRRAAGRPALLTVDDANLLDDASAALVHQVATEAAARVVVTIRTGDPKPDPLIAMLKEGDALRIELGPLTGTEVAKLLGEVLGTEVDRATVHRLQRVSGGNPLYLRELVTSGLDSGSLSSESGIWRWRGPLVPGRGLLELIGGRLAQLGEGELSVLEHLALGEPLSPEVLEMSCSPPAIVTAERGGWLTANADGRRVEVRLAHPLYAEVLRSRIPPLGARAIRRQLADALCSLGGSSAEDLLRIVTWRLDGGQQPAPDELARAASAAMSAFDYRLAERLARASLDAGGGAAVSMLLARALRGQGWMDEAEAVFAALADSALPAERLLLAPERAANLFFGLDRRSEADEILVQAERSAPDQESEDLLACTRGMFALTAGRPGNARKIAAAILDRPSATTRAVVEASVLAAHASLVLGEVSLGRSTADRAIHLADQSRAETRAILELLDASAAADWLNGKLAQSERTAARHYRVALEEGVEPARAVWSLCLGLIALQMGRVVSARTWLEEAAGLIQGVDSAVRLPLCLALLAQVHAITGEFDRADSALDRARAIPTASLISARTRVQLGEAWLSASRGELSRASQLALQVADETHRLGYLLVESEALHAVARFGSAELVADRLESLAGDIDALFVHSWSEHVRALANRDGRALDDVGRGFEEMGAQLLAAEAAVDAAAMHRRHGLRARAADSRAAADRRLRRCEGARTPALERLSLEELLTRREREVAALAAQGLTSREIAERLFVSVRTVDNHLRQVYDKLGIRSRADLAENPDGV
jgi:DNA-binding CsgD family transcriptional regulator